MMTEAERRAFTAALLRLEELEARVAELTSTVRALEAHAADR